MAPASSLLGQLCGGLRRPGAGRLCCSSPAELWDVCVPRFLAWFDFPRRFSHLFQKRPLGIAECGAPSILAVSLWLSAQLWKGGLALGYKAECGTLLPAQFLCLTSLSPPWALLCLRPV